ncbi:hypothetical protein TanjilG_01488 [Lupinus angustifolius]|uniref:Leucine-rich repeat-containing N-terminal plant-type domain-containing protein n=2 Tax=Lupinus angustifolius TaxID=3871 RepID=A0A4P1QVJ0_LUPAN|nr:hypothetical protein TanjilG_01488 [Lupinus angustifolius]
MALIMFKQDIIDPFNKLSTWSSEHDCCAWEGVYCHNTTGRVISLDLYSFGTESKYLEGEINLSALFQLEFLSYIDLSYNFFTTLSVPSIHNNFTTRLQYLDLAGNDGLHIDHLNWLSQLSSLKYLNLSHIDIHKQTNWLHTMALLPSLSELHLSRCKLTNIYPSLKYVNFTSLVTLDLSQNNFSSKLPHWLFNLTSDISEIRLGGSNLHGEIPLSLLNLQTLEVLDLSKNSLSGSIPSSIGNLSSLIYFDISSNFLRGNVPESIGQLFKLNTLHIGNNGFSGVLSDMFFSKLSNLQSLDLSNSNFEFEMDTNWIPSFQLSEIDLSNTLQGPNFPSWLSTQMSLEYLDISNTRISSIEVDVWNFVAGIDNIYLSNNSISGDISNITLTSSIISLDHNNFTGRLPGLTANAGYVDVSHNSFSEGLPNGLENLEELIYINMESNKLTGELPLDMSNMTILEFIYLGNNEFSGNIPMKMPPSLKLLILRSNQFEGNIPSQLCGLTSLSILDLAHNKLSGPIPHCLHNITSMVSGETNSEAYFLENTFNLIMKGQELEFEYIGRSQTIDLSVNNLSGEIPSGLFSLVKVRSLNLSHNHLTGKILKTIGDLKNIESLDLSYNQFSGEIPQSISGLTFLESFNLSYNNFSGQIPQGPQLQTFDAWSYVGNPALCGVPLTKNCTQEENPSIPKQHSETDPFKESLYLGIGVGFAVGFWGVSGSLFLNKTLRYTYFRLLSRVADRIYVIVAVKFRNFRGT